MSDVVSSVPDSGPETNERRQFSSGTSEYSLGYTPEASSNEVGDAPDPVTSAAREKIAGAGALKTPIEDASFQINETENPFENYSEPAEIHDFGLLTSEIATELEDHHIVILHGSAGRLTDLAYAVVHHHFSSWHHRSFYPRQKANSRREQDVMTIEDLIESPFLKPPILPPGCQKLVVVHDLNAPNLTPLVPDEYSGSRGLDLLKQLKRSQDLRVLVVTHSETWSRLMRNYGAEVMNKVARKIDLQPDGDTHVPAQVTLSERIAGMLDSYGKLGFITLWCIAWLPNASLDDIIFSIEKMIRHWRRKAEDRDEALERWRMDWSGILARIGAKQVERSQSVRVELPSEVQAEDVQRLLRINFRMFHLEMFGLMRESGVLKRAEPELLQIFAISLARLAREERQPGKSVLVHLVEAWLHDAPEERIVYTLTALFCAVVRDGETDFASDMLAQLPGNGYPEAAAAILARCPPRFLTQAWFIALYNRILPSLTLEVRLEMLSRLIRMSASSRQSIEEAVVLAKANLSNNLFLEFVARFVEELLLGDRPRAGRLLEVLQAAETNPNEPGRMVFAAIRSFSFRDYADRRANEWAPRKERNALFDTWIVKTLIPIVPSVSPRNVIHLFGQALAGDDSLRTPHVERPGSPADQVIAMLLTDYGAALGPDEEWGTSMTVIFDLSIPDRDGVIAVYETLRSLAERFYRVSRVLAFLSPGETTFELGAKTAIRKFFEDKSKLVDRLRRLIECKYFKGAKK